ncbi:MAG: hypothetical protein KDH09_05350 [Chrysiogenetes bacterium]|nr:hypothetical protein [Chrysiogenetes bacterium]
MPSRFDIDYADPAIAWEPLVDEVFGELTSSFIEMPKGNGFVEYVAFEKGYQTLKRHTDAFAVFTRDTVLAAVRETPIAFVVFRCILGFTPPEWAYVTTEMTDVSVDQGAARSIDRRIRLEPLTPMNEGTGVTAQRMCAMIDAGIRTIVSGAQSVPPGIVHRMDKADTAKGMVSVQSIASLGVPYPVVLYERFLGRPFATHRDSVSELVGEVVEVAIKNVLSNARISFRETTRAERIPGFDQTPDFIVPDEFTPVALIEAKLTEDDGTARDKVARVQRLRTLRDENGKDYDVVACIAGRGFKVRREDMRRLLQATDGKVFTLATMQLLLTHTRIREYRVR